MRIHTDVLTEHDLYAALNECPGVWLDECEKHGSRSRQRAFVVRLVSDGTPDQAGTPRRRRPNPGTSRAPSTDYAASYDDWGWWLARLFEQDHAMTATYYRSADDFHRQTSDKYRRAAKAAS